MASSSSSEIKLESVYIHTLYDNLRRIENLNFSPFESGSRSILDHILGEVPQEVKEFCSTPNEDLESFTYLKLFFIAAHVLGNPIEMIRRYCVLNRNETEAEEEAQFLWSASSEVAFAPRMIRMIFTTFSSKYYAKYRCIADAVFVKTVHLILAAFEKKSLPEIEIPNIEPIMDYEKHEILEKLLTGDIPQYSRFVHEVIRTHFDQSDQHEHAMKDMLAQTMLFTSAAAIDACSRSVLRVALISTSYIDQVFIPYILRYYYNEKTPTYNLAPTWHRIEVYFPPKTNFIFPSNPSDPANILHSLITKLPEALWEQIEQIAVPSEQEMAWLEMVSVADVIPGHLKSKFIASKENTVSKQKLPTKRQRC